MKRASCKRRLLGAVLLPAVAMTAACDRDEEPIKPGFGVTFESVSYEYDPEFVGAELVDQGATLITLGDEIELTGRTHGQVRAPRLVDAFAAGMIIHTGTDRVLALDLRVPGAKSPYLFDAEHTAAALVMIQPMYWGWQPRQQARLYERILGHDELGALIGRIESAQAEGRAFYEDDSVIEQAAFLARDIAVAFSREQSEAVEVGDEAIPALTARRHLAFSPEEEAGTVQIRNYGPLAESLVCFRGGEFEPTMDAVVERAQDSRCAGPSYLRAPEAIYGFFAVPAPVPVLQAFVHEAAESMLTLEVEGTGYQRFVLVPCATCPIGTAWRDNPAVENTFLASEDVLAYLFGETMTQAKLSSADTSEFLSLYDAVWRDNGRFSRAARRVADGEWGRALAETVHGLRNNAGPLATMSGLDRYERGLLEELLARLADVAAPSAGMSASLVEGATDRYAAARVLTLLRIASKERVTSSWDVYRSAVGEQQLDVVFLIDSSASMRGVMAEAKERVTNLATNLSDRVADVRFGVADFRDVPTLPYGEPDDWAFEMRSHLDSDVLTVRYALREISADGGGDNAEAHLEAIATAVERFSWAEGAQPVIIVISEVEGHNAATEPDYPGPTLDEVATTLVDRDVRLIGLSAGVSATAFLQDLALRADSLTIDGDPAVFAMSTESTELADEILSAVRGRHEGPGIEPELRERALEALPFAEPN